MGEKNTIDEKSTVKFKPLTEDIGHPPEKELKRKRFWPLLLSIVLMIVAGRVTTFSIEAFGQFFESVLDNGGWQYLALNIMVGYGVMAGIYKLNNMESKNDTNESWVFGYWNNDNKK